MRNLLMMCTNPPPFFLPLFAPPPFPQVLWKCSAADPAAVAELWASCADRM